VSRRRLALATSVLVLASVTGVCPAAAARAGFARSAGEPANWRAGPQPLSFLSLRVFGKLRYANDIAFFCDLLPGRGR
jgi:hypothetical protein